jgi:hypothetical protein
MNSVRLQAKKQRVLIKMPMSVQHKSKIQLFQTIEFSYFLVMKLIANNLELKFFEIELTFFEIELEKV